MQRRRSRARKNPQCEPGEAATRFATSANALLILLAVLERGFDCLGGAVLFASLGTGPPDPAAEINVQAASGFQRLLDKTAMSRRPKLLTVDLLPSASAGNKRSRDHLALHPLNAEGRFAMLNENWRAPR